MTKKLKKSFNWVMTRVLYLLGGIAYTIGCDSFDTMMGARIYAWCMLVSAELSDGFWTGSSLLSSKKDMQLNYGKFTGSIVWWLTHENSKTKR